MGERSDHRLPGAQIGLFPTSKRTSKHLLSEAAASEKGA